MSENFNLWDIWFSILENESIETKLNSKIEFLEKTNKYLNEKFNYLLIYFLKNTNENKIFYNYDILYNNYMILKNKLDFLQDKINMIWYKKINI